MAQTPATFKAHYLRTFIWMQTFIVGVCLLLRYGFDLEWNVVIAAFVAMQIANVISAWNGARVRRKIEGTSDRLPLER
jgi:ABC-type bacteriocin/lantibiotic exporter with double-glycine peptidase domain